METDTHCLDSRTSISAKAIRSAESVRRKYGRLSVYFHRLDSGRSSSINPRRKRATAASN